MTDTSGASKPTDRDAPIPSHVLEAIPREADAPPSEFTLVPCDVEGMDRMTRWITVDAADIVDLSAWR